ncbi:hypothetical protein ABZP36_030605 [Zizania latifolia]
MTVSRPLPCTYASGSDILWLHHSDAWQQLQLQLLLLAVSFAFHQWRTRCSDVQPVVVGESCGKRMADEETVVLHYPTTVYCLLNVVY